jgi:inorganic pyrophosphatase
MESALDFWMVLLNLAQTGSLILDRPRGSPHPRYPEMIYPLDYGYLEETSAGDGDGIDVWIGSRPEKTLTGILCSFDKLKRDAEIKLLIGCTQDDIQAIQDFHSDMAILFIPNPLADHDLSE